MAPRKRKAVEEDGAAAKIPVVVNRRSPRLANLTSEIPVPAPAPELAPKKKGKANPKKEKVKEEPEKKDEEAETKIEEDGSRKTIVIEHCKQCNSFKTRAVQVKTGLENAVPGVSVLLNPKKPRRGCFEIREEDGETFISLQNLKRPFKDMKDLDMEKVISDIIDKIKS
ncbi:uncharacterized protein [Euphorbia lathyris]|uniref:uncharacterized protein n=1 Tax=Euphorbia lathyris TaxID=212925 RepID=UPI003313883D